MLTEGALGTILIPKLSIDGVLIKISFPKLLRAPTEISLSKVSIEGAVLSKK